VSYANEIKQDFLNVDKDELEKNGAVSEEVITQLATNIRAQFNTDFSIATSGIAGPDGGSEEKPVGTVWIAIASKNGVTAKKYLFGNHRHRTIERTALTALMMLRREIMND
jgi:nicotinamide-nucleotide amidase